MLAASGNQLIVVELYQVQNDLVLDMIDVLTSFCVPLYGHYLARKLAYKTALYGSWLIEADSFYRAASCVLSVVL